MHQGVEKFIEAEQRRKTSGVCWWVTGVWSCLTGNRMSGMFTKSHWEKENYR
ncbi:hypothetical protein HanRHA438_Chr07g0299141 [Helianthus annuus]|uniref:Uncharacterized protein n=1 Tax=Helianthus annuus TaxID=4232 RepID=A0A251TGV6_HELAN|nr:hypothetical protein HanHA300_Chr07g0237211 [Helianthus annuus]KAJ0556232.1 hypothetical protein HanIR_Chr07g0311391 [Helianthus annuus]KAJ0562683.1 hypothetical protein HanHA89_Chr07g0254401 [Helianthus annuus]KAJ0728059.1 hypothetical protein HanLR1_Chr07g0237171 [Helianthus annuus]KAJ0730834.1 hypothetical protein HanOQP8_Chr07g0244891 [Helianthus annuus]